MLSDYCLYGWYGVVHDANNFQDSLSEWMKDKPLSILQLDPADRAVLRIAGEGQYSNVVIREGFRKNFE
ncbi:uncharacterized protein TNCT_675221 [Trichonephila clavata]|uniref:Uncharacterized protein n=1 Tax=Trichonephila clavata TaxID=2740835 RepID=A0A8X6JMS7_TRICU|nr:uncharacterized protein TNCT_675221 [Trichonephila clavata]